MAVNFEIETTRIEVGSGYFTVRGLNTEDITFLTVHYLDDLKALIAKNTINGAVQKNAVAELLMQVAKDFPMMVTEIISRCAEAESADDVQKFRRLSFVKQIEALKAITLLSVEDGAFDLKKVLEVVEKLLVVNGLPSGPLMSKLRNTIETYEKPSAD